MRAHALRTVLARGLLTTLTIVILLQGLRVLLPLLYEVREEAGSLLAVGIAFAVFLSPLFAAPLRRVVGARWALVVAVVGLAVARLGFQTLPPIPLWLAAGVVALGLVALTLQLHAVPINANRTVRHRRPILRILVAARMAPPRSPGRPPGL